MKKLLIIIIAFSSILVTINSCKKSGGEINPLSSASNNGIGSYLVLDSTISTSLNSTAIVTSTIGIAVHAYPGGEAVDHVDIFATSSPTFDTTQWHFVTSIPYTEGGTKLTVTGGELGTALGVDPTTFATGTTYTFYTRVITKSGKYYDVSNTGNNTGSGLITGPTYFSAFSFNGNIVCPFVAPMAGTYKVVQDDWGAAGDGGNSTGDLVQVTDGPGANQLNLSKVWPNPAFGDIIDSLIVDVDPTTGVATIAAGINWGDYTVYGGYTAVTGAGSGGNVFSCTGLITLNIDVLAPPFGDQGPFKLVLQKQ
jgi:hypothetical protein